MSPAPPSTAPSNDNQSTTEEHIYRLPLPSHATQQPDSRTQRPAAVIPIAEPCHKETDYVYIKRSEAPLVNGTLPISLLRSTVTRFGQRGGGWRVVVNTSDLRKLYVDDLVTTQSAQSSGVGKILLAELRLRAIAQGCFTLELDSGVKRYDAHRFSLRERMNIDAHHFTLELPTRPEHKTQTP